MHSEPIIQAKHAKVFRKHEVLGAQTTPAESLGIPQDLLRNRDTAHGAFAVTTDGGVHTFLP